MPYLCFYYLDVEPGKEKNVIESLLKNREDIILKRYKDLEFFKPFIRLPSGVLVRAEFSSREDVPKFMGYLKAQEHVKDVILRGEGLTYHPYWVSGKNK